MEPENNQSPNLPTQTAQAATSPPPFPQTTPSTDQATAHTPEVEKEKKKPNILLIVGAVIILLLIILAGYYLWTYYQTKQENISQQIQTEQPVVPTPTPTADPTAGWETYINNIYFYSVMIPPDWSPDRGYPGGSYTDEQLQGSDSISWLKNDARFSIHALQECNSETTSCFEEIQTDADTQGGPYSSERTDTTSNNYLGMNVLIARSSYSGSDNTVRGIFFVNGNKLWNFETQSSPDLSNDVETEVDQILSTFKFIEESEVDVVRDTSCVISGCNGEICAAESMSSICVYKDEYACYTSAICEVQPNGKCGWTQTEELSVCVSSN